MASALQRAENHAQQTIEFGSSGTGRHGGIQDLQGHAAINRQCQSSLASPQKACIFFGAISSAAASARALSLRRSSCWSRLISR